ncbi:Bor family protein [Microbulbifer thermotolerans]|uniref:Lipoprotein bor n=1 Tax=Microbulbifer thermotolerans TaxID=252514 RepID=A0A143HPJ8_MICTH|nr:Bor family protein [Microbulbifer thermotolerans]AMX03608.1 lipoprotein bor [Microbulbifer thermotolerans]MCX2781028.1 Bor family protein [Microbulbifer thermotolerans]MCX2782131.1 Bor family protein [Microbulbifer thermotolerans]MCX2804577.1 Bor family protein [Microbulbifer thermotolerans]MCX2831364.1 Bor family protein [Microbulbifer thermotolerans]
MKIKLFSAFLASSLLFGCASQTFTINGEGGEVPTSQKTQHFFVSGIGQEKITNAAEICGGAENIVKVEAQHTFMNGFLSFITYGIYTPRDAKVYCKSE